MKLLTNLEVSTALNGVVAAIACVFVLFTVWRTCRFIRVPKLQDVWATLFQDLFHLSLFCAVFLIAIDHIIELGGSQGLLTDYLSPPLSDFFTTLTALSWSGYRLRKNWFQRQNLDLSEDLHVVKKANDETTCHPL